MSVPMPSRGSNKTSFAKPFRLLKIAALSSAIVVFGQNAHAESFSDWAGLHLGIFAGTATAETDILGNRFTYDSSRSRNEVDHNYSGNIFGGIIGYDFQDGPVVIGFEAEFAQTDLESKKVFNSDNDIDEVSMNWYALAAARLGIAAHSTLFYGKAGLAWAEFSNRGGDMDASGFDEEDAHDSTNILPGVAWGGGIEHAFTNRLSMRVEYLRMSFEGYTEANADPAVPQQKYKVDNGPVETIKIGLSYRF